MCNYKSKELQIECTYSAILEKPLPLREGLCVFHSENIAWKYENNFYEYLIQLIQKYDSIKNEKEVIRLEEILFIKDENEEFFNRTFSKEISFDRSSFLDDLIIENVNFDKGVSFKDALFVKDVSIRRSKGQRFEFENAKFEKNIYISDCEEISNFHMTGSQVNGGISVKKSTFTQSVFLNEMKVNLDSNLKRGVSFNTVEFKGYVSFDDSQFNNIISFEKVKIFDSVVFKNVDFNYNQSLPIYSSVTFQKIEIENKGRLAFYGTDTHKIFSGSHDVSFTYEKLDGIVSFFNTDFTKFSNEVKTQLIRESKESDAKVVIGTGCLKYRHQTNIKCIKLSHENQTLASELANTFTKFFTNSQEISLGVEIIERNENEIKLYYFSDADISLNEFTERLSIVETEMWALIKIENQNILTKTDIETNKSLSIKGNLTKNLLMGTDTIIEIVAFLLKFTSRIPLGRITKEETISLFNTTLFGATNELDITSITNLNIYQNVLLGIGNKQSVKLKE